jgi:hypothetical protein
MNEDSDLPLHDEAKARAKWRGEKSEGAADLDEAAGGDGRKIAPADTVLEDLAKRPPD